MENQIPAEHAKDYILAGKATVGFHSTKSGDTYWFYVKKKDSYWNVYMDYSTGEEDRYLGTIRKYPEDKYLFNIPSDKAPTGIKETYIKVFRSSWYIPNHHQLIILHKGHCSFCGRPLKDAESLMKGVGPVCRKKLGIP